MNLLKLYGEYLNERYGSQHLIEIKDGFAVYEVVKHENKNALHIYSFYSSPNNRGFKNGKSGSRELFEKLKKIAKENNCDAMTCFIWLNSHRGNKILKLYLYLGFEAIGGEGHKIRLTYYMDKDEKR